ncbi:MAG: hypothetical protein ACI4UE_05155 [Candidatus Scatovivens sp.]
MIDIVLEIEQKQVYLALVYKGQVSLFFCRSPPVDLTLKVELMGGFLMKKIIIDGYEIIVENRVLTRAIFKDFDGNEINIELGEKMQMEFLERRREEFKEQNERRRHIDNLLRDDSLFEIRTAEKSYSIEEMVINEEQRDFIIQEIWKLPHIQARRTFMFLINEYSLTKIARIERVSVTAIDKCVEKGIKKIEKKLKNFN